MTQPLRVAVLGAGAWGTALATVAARRGHAVSLWCRDPAHAAALLAARENHRDLPGVALAAGIAPTADAGCVIDADLVLAAVPAQALRDVLSNLPPPRAPVPVVVGAKGIERTTGLLMSGVVAQCLPGHPAAALSGPSFAADVGRGRPTAVTLAARDGDLARRLAEALALPTFRLYHTDDLVGVEIGGAVKNVLAIACGIAAGLDLGASAAAALVARGFAELARFARARGARPETLAGLSGLGDLVLTCTTDQSRNFALGRALGRGETLVAARGRLAEGVATAGIVCRLARAGASEVPICDGVAAVVAGTSTPRQALEALLARPPRSEGGDAGAEVARV